MTVQGFEPWQTHVTLMQVYVRSTFKREHQIRVAADAAFFTLQKPAADTEKVQTSFCLWGQRSRLRPDCVNAHKVVPEAPPPFSERVHLSAVIGLCQVVNRRSHSQLQPPPPKTSAAPTAGGLLDLCGLFLLSEQLFANLKNILL